MTGYVRFKERTNAGPTFPEAERSAVMSQLKRHGVAGLFPHDAPGDDSRTVRHPRQVASPEGRPPEIFSQRLMRAVHTHALCMHTQDRLGWRHRRAGRRRAPAHGGAHTLHTHAYAALIRPREKHPRNPHLRRAAEQETAGHSGAQTHCIRRAAYSIDLPAGMAPRNNRLGWIVGKGKPGPRGAGSGSSWA